jgi:hypothetical protein
MIKKYKTMSYKPFKMKGSPMQRNFGIGEGEAPDATSPINKFNLGEALSAGLETLPGGKKKGGSDAQEFERDEEGKLILHEGKPIPKQKEGPGGDLSIGDNIKNIGKKIKGFFSAE